MRIEARAAITDGAGAVSIADIEVGDPGPGEVRVDIAASGVCHTDWDIAQSAGRKTLLGHEGAGTVSAIGPGVEGLSTGDRVLLSWCIPCGHCFQCVRGSQVHCEVLGLTSGGHAHAGATTIAGSPLPRAFNLGTMSTSAVVRAEAVVRITIDIPFTSACILGCGVMTGFGSVVNAARVEPGASAVVMGCGGVGLNAIQGARISGATRIIAVDIAEARLETARRFGATDVVLADRDDAGLLHAAAQVRAMTGGRGADYAFECTGIPSLAFAPLAMVRHCGTAVQVSGVEQDLAVDMNLFEWDKVYLNPLYGKCRPAVDFPRLFALYERGELLLDELVTRTYTLDELPRAFEDLMAGRNAKGVLVLG